MTEGEIELNIDFNLVLNAAVFSLCILSNGDHIHVFIASIDTTDAATGTDIGVQVEHSEWMKEKGM